METKRGNQPTADNGKGKKDDKPVQFTSGLSVNGEFNIAEKITLAVREGKILLRRKPQGTEVELSEQALAGLLVEEYFVDAK
jgi:hypothetical protein